MKDDLPFQCSNWPAVLILLIPVLCLLCGPLALVLR